jgi:DNA ligase (NAD+)
MLIEGFAEKTGLSVVKALALIKDDFMKIYNLGFNLVPTRLMAEQAEKTNPISGLAIVFTGTMQHGKRDDMIKEAKRLGAKVGSSVTGKTDILITGSDVGTNKLNDAKKFNVMLMNEMEYLTYIGTKN